MTEEFERRLRAFGAAVDAAAEAEQARRKSSSPDAGAIDLGAIIAARRSPRRMYQAMAIAAAAIVVVFGAIVAVAGLQPSPSAHLDPGIAPDTLVAVDTTGPGPETTEPEPASTTTAPTTTSPTTTAPTTASPAAPTMAAAPREDAPVCPSYSFQGDFHFSLCDKGQLVALIQQRLVENGASIAVDGYYGPGTRDAVRAFQREHGLTVDGQVGPETWALLLPDAPGFDADGDGIVGPKEVTTEVGAMVPR